MEEGRWIKISNDDNVIAGYTRVGKIAVIRLIFITDNNDAFLLK